MHSERDDFARQIDDMLASVPQPAPDPPDPLTEAARSISDEWQRVRAHLPADVFDALPEDVMVRSVPDPEADAGVHASFVFADGTLVSYRDEHATTATRHADGSVLLVAYRFGEEKSRHTIPAAAIVQSDPDSN